MLTRLLHFRPDPPAGGDAPPPAAPPGPAAGDPPTPPAPPAPPAGDAPPVPPVPPVPPPPAEIVYDLKLPEAAALDATALERTAAFAKAQGLSPAVAQAALDFANTEVSAATAAALAAYQPGDPTKNIAPGAAWVKQNTEWTAAALADPELGAGKPEQLAKVVDGAKRVLAKFADADTAAFLEQTGLGSNPAALRMLHRIGTAMSEGSLAIPGNSDRSTPTPEERLQALYPSMAPKK